MNCGWTILCMRKCREILELSQFCIKLFLLHRSFLHLFRPFGYGVSDTDLITRRIYTCSQCNIIINLMDQNCAHLGHPTLDCLVPDSYCTFSTKMPLTGLILYMKRVSLLYNRSLYIKWWFSINCYPSPLLTISLTLYPTHTLPLNAFGFGNFSQSNALLQFLPDSINFLVSIAVFLLVLASPFLWQIFHPAPVLDFWQNCQSTHLSLFDVIDKHTIWLIQLWYHITLAKKLSQS